MKTLREHVHKGMFLHAYAREGRWEEFKDELLTLAAGDLKLPLSGTHPDALLIEAESFGIDESRALEALARRRGVFSDEKLYVLAVSSITHEAQNALLKLLEDAPVGLHVIVLIPSFSLLLPTLRSRLFLITAESVGKQTISWGAAETFLKVSKKKRLEILAPLIESKDKKGVSALLDGLEVVFSRELQKNTVGLRASGIREVLRARRYLSDRSSSLKLLLEHLALSLPLEVK